MRQKESREQTGVRSGCEIGKDRDSEIRENFAGEIRNPHNQTEVFNAPTLFRFFDKRAHTPPGGILFH